MVLLKNEKETKIVLLCLNITGFFFKYQNLCIANINQQFQMPLGEKKCEWYNLKYFKFCLFWIFIGFYIFLKIRMGKRDITLQKKVNFTGSDAISQFASLSEINSNTRWSFHVCRRMCTIFHVLNYLYCSMHVKLNKYIMF